MDKQKMLELLNEKLPLAINELNGDSDNVIDDLFGYRISEEYIVNNESREDIIISLNIYNFSGEEPKLFLLGIDNEGVVDVINVSPATSGGLDAAYDKMNEIVSKGEYTEAFEWSIMG